MTTLIGRRWGPPAWPLLFVVFVLGISIGGGIALLAATGVVGGPRAAAPFAAPAAAAPGHPAAAGLHVAKKTALPPYTVTATGTNNANQLNTASASCDPGDQASGGGFEGVDLATTRIVDSSPFNSINNAGLADTWTVDYTNGASGDAVTAIVVCADKKPAHP